MALDKNQQPPQTNEFIDHIEIKDYMELTLILLVKLQVKSNRIKNKVTKIVIKRLSKEVNFI